MNTPLRFGILGLGRGSSGMIVALARHPAAQIAAAADLRPEPLTDQPLFADHEVDARDVGAATPRRAAGRLR